MRRSVFLLDLFSHKNSTLLQTRRLTFVPSFPSSLSSRCIDSSLEDFRSLKCFTSASLHTQKLPAQNSPQSLRSKEQGEDETHLEESSLKIDETKLRFKEKGQEWYYHQLYSLYLSEDYDLMQRTFEEAKLKRVDILPISYSHMLDAIGKSGDLVKLKNFFKNEVKKQRSPQTFEGEPQSHEVATVRNYGIMIRYFSLAEEFEEVDSLLAEMKRAGIRRDSHIFSDLMNGYGRVGDTDRMLQIFKEMKAEGIPRSTVAFTILIRAFAKQADTEKMWSVFQTMKKCGVRANQVTYNALLSAFARKGEIGRALAIFEEMKSEGWTPNYRNLHCILEAYRRKGDTFQMMEFFEKFIRSATEKDLDLAYRSFTVLLDGFGRRAELEQMTLIFREVRKDQNIKPQPRQFQRMMVNFVRAQESKKLLELFQIMKRQGYKPDVYCYNTLIFGTMETADPKSHVEKILEEMKKANVKPNAETYSGIIYTFAQTEDLKSMLKYYRIMKRDKVSPVRSTYTTIIKALVTDGDFGQAVEIYNDMIKAGIEPVNFIKKIMGQQVGPSELASEGNRNPQIRASSSPRAALSSSYEGSGMFAT